MRSAWILVALGWLLAGAPAVRAADHDTRPATARETEFFEARVRPVLADHCWGCHGPRKQKSGLRLDSPTALLKGSDNGPVVVPGDAENSLLVRAIRREGPIRMP